MNLAAAIWMLGLYASMCVQMMVPTRQADARA